MKKQLFIVVFLTLIISFPQFISNPISAKKKAERLEPLEIIIDTESNVYIFTEEEYSSRISFYLTKLNKNGKILVHNKIMDKHKFMFEGLILDSKNKFHMVGNEEIENESKYVYLVFDIDGRIYNKVYRTNFGEEHITIKSNKNDDIFILAGGYFTKIENYNFTKWYEISICYMPFPTLNNNILIDDEGNLISITEEFILSKMAYDGNLSFIKSIIDEHFIWKSTNISFSINNNNIILFWKNPENVNNNEYKYYRLNLNGDILLNVNISNLKSIFKFPFIIMDNNQNAHVFESNYPNTKKTNYLKIDKNGDVVKEEKLKLHSWEKSRTKLNIDDENNIHIIVQDSNGDIKYYKLDDSGKILSSKTIVEEEELHGHSSFLCNIIIILLIFIPIIVIFFRNKNKRVQKKNN